MKKGDRAKIKKNTFLFQGFFVHTNSIVEIAEITEEGIHVVYNDKEGFPHVIPNLKESELELV
ncbi:MAG: hypothetical protein H7A24_17740 [Leptospiraceae bacterium]|nr:hypothetical protein [Leptospiraceae bacterium]MCP5513737.1 hypothetical protein [Leptospiraceae bacterium]